MDGLKRAQRDYSPKGSIRKYFKLTWWVVHIYKRDTSLRV